MEDEPQRRRLVLEGISKRELKDFSDMPTFSSEVVSENLKKRIESHEVGDLILSGSDRRISKRELKVVLQDLRVGVGKPPLNLKKRIERP